MTVAAQRANLAAGYQEAIVPYLAIKPLRRSCRLGSARLAVVGGVSANSRLRVATSANEPHRETD